MAKRNRNSIKGTNKENRTGKPGAEEVNYRKLKDNPRHRSDESISTRDHAANGKYSKVRRWDEDVNNTETRGGR